MKTIIVICVMTTAVLAFTVDVYSPIYENFDVREIIENPRLLRSYGNCFLDKGPCSPEGIDFKKAIPEALKTVCGKCTPRQRRLVRMVVDAFKTKQPAIWNELVRKLDPKGVHTKAFENFLRETD